MSGAEPWILQSGQLGYVRKGKMDVRLIETHGGRLSVGGTGERRRREETKGAGDDGAFVRKTTQTQHRYLVIIDKTHMSPNIFSVKRTPLSFLGLAIMIIAAESTSWCSSLS